MLFFYSIEPTLPFPRNTAFFHPVVTGGSRLFLARGAADGFLGKVMLGSLHKTKQFFLLSINSLGGVGRKYLFQEAFDFCWNGKRFNSGMCLL